MRRRCDKGRAQCANYTHRWRRSSVGSSILCMQQAACPESAGHLHAASRIVFGPNTITTITDTDSDRSGQGRSTCRIVRLPVGRLGVKSLCSICLGEPRGETNKSAGCMKMIIYFVLFGVANSSLSLNLIDLSTCLTWPGWLGLAGLRWLAAGRHPGRRVSCKMHWPTGNNGNLWLFPFRGVKLKFSTTNNVVRSSTCLSVCRVS